MSRDVLQDYGAARLVVVCSFINNFLLEGNVRSFGFLYRDIIGRFEGSASGTAWIKATYSLVAMTMGPVTVILLERYGYRSVVVVGALLQTAAFLASAFATSILYLYLSYGLCAGLGGGFIYVTKAAIVNRHFDRYRGRALSVAMVGGPIGVAVFSQTISSLLDSYAYRGTMFILAGLALHHCVAAFLYMPSLQRVRKKDPLLGWERGGGEAEEGAEQEEEEEVEEGEGDGKGSGCDRDESQMMTDFDEMQGEGTENSLLVREQGRDVGEEGNEEKTRDNISAEAEKGDGQECISAMDESIEVRPIQGKVDSRNLRLSEQKNGNFRQIATETDEVGCVDNSSLRETGENLPALCANGDVILQNQHMLREEHSAEEDFIGKKRNVINGDLPVKFSNSHITTCNVSSKAFAKELKDVEKHSTKKQLFLFLQTRLLVLKNCAFLLFCMHIFTMPFAVASIYMFMPSLAAERGISPDKLALPMVIVCVASIVGGLLSGPVFDVSYIRSRVDLFEALIGLLLGLSVILLGVFGVSFATFLPLSCLYGLLEGSICTQRSNAVFGYVQVEQFPLALGVATFFQGVGNFVGPVMLGLACDMWGSYVYCFILGGAAMSLSSTLLIVVYFRKGCR